MSDYPRDDVDPNQAPGGQNKPREHGGPAGAISGDRNQKDRHPGYTPKPAG